MSDPNPDQSDSVESPFLSDESPLAQTWTPVEVIDDVSRLTQIRTALSALNQDDTDDQTTTVLTRATFNDQLTTVTDADRGLSVREFNALLAGLEECGVATDCETRGVSYANSEFDIALSAAIEVLDQWVAAAAYGDTRAEQREEQTIVELVATLPPDTQSWIETRVDRTGLELRHLAVQADEGVRIAAPYIDPDEAVLEDIAALPAQGVVVRLLTRQAVGPDADSDQREAVETLSSKVGSEALDALAIRDLFERDPAGSQREAVHAKTVIVDEEQAYIGSANFTSTGLGSNFELGVLLGGPLVDDVVTVFDAMFERADPVPL